MSWFASVAPLPPDPILGLSEACKEDPRKEKLDLTAGTFRTPERLEPYMFEAVKRAEEQLLKVEKNKDYLPVAGDPLFLDRLGAVVFGNEDWSKYRANIASLQTAGASGSLRVGGEFLHSLLQRPIYISAQTWPNHRHIMRESGFIVDSYPYYDFKRHELNFEGLYKFCEGLPPSTPLLLHLCCHNPTGCDLTLDQWKALSELMRRKKLFPFLDCAYQGFGEGIDKDRSPLHIFIKDGHEFLLSYSCSKTFTIYSERAGALFVFTKEERIAKTVLSVIKMKSRGLISNSPAHGALIVSIILHDPALRASWLEDIEKVRKRVAVMRQKLVEILGEKYAFIGRGKGIYSVLGLSGPQVEQLRKEYGIYMTLEGRINLTALNEESITYLANAMRNVIPHA